MIFSPLPQPFRGQLLGIAADRKPKIKMELDTDPPAGAETELETLLLPIPFQVKIYRPSCLFAGKIHALLCRNWKRRVKGRDFHDFVWSVAKGIPAHLAHLQRRMEQTGHWDGAEAVTGEALLGLLRKRFSEIDFDLARADVLPFVRDADAVALWGRSSSRVCWTA